MSDNPVFVTRPFLPPLDEFLPYLRDIWDSRQLTNEGPMHAEFEQALCNYLGVQHISLFCNCTIALLTALQALGIKGEVITTPYSFVATSHSLLWNGITPVFADIDPLTLNLDPVRIEAAITSHTQAILPVHCYGTPCDVTEIADIARRHQLKVIYDAAHAFAVRDSGGSILRHGDLAVLSFHATKVFNTFEGGAIICPDAATKRYIDQLKNFGFVGETAVVEAGINGKMSEFNASLGHLQLKYIDQALSQRQQIDALYREQLQGVKGIRLLQPNSEIIANYGYFPILIEDDFPLSRDSLYQLLADHGIFARRYFYPLISEFSMYRDLPSATQTNLPVATRIAQQVLCLPLYPDLPAMQARMIGDFIAKAGQ